MQYIYFYTHFKWGMMDLNPKHLYWKHHEMTFDLMGIGIMQNIYS